MKYIDLQIDFVNWLIPFSMFLVKPIVHSGCLFLIPSMIMGIGFPIALQAYANRVHKVGRSTGTAYGANTIGAVIGGILTGFVLIPFLGVQASVSILGLAGVWTAAVMWAVFFDGGKLIARGIGIAGALALTISVFWMPQDLFSRVVATIKNKPRMKLVAVEEGVTATVSVHKDERAGWLRLYASGQSLAGDNLTARGDQKMMGHLGVLLNVGSSRVLSVGFGSGETTACLSLHDLEAVDCVEIAPGVVKVALEYFRHINLGDRLEQEINMIYMDAKNYLHLTDSEYDVIMNDPIHPRFFAENASLYTREYFESARKRLREGGVLISWIPTYQMPVSVVKSIIGTLLEVYEHVTVWYLTPHPAPLILVIGSEDEQYYSPAYIDAKLSDEKIRANLAEILFYDSRDVLSCYICDEEDLAEVIKGYSLNSDYRPFIEFTTDEEARQWTLLEHFVLGIRSKSLYRHLDWSGMGEDERARWESRYERLYKALDEILPIHELTKDPSRLRLPD